MVYYHYAELLELEPACRRLSVCLVGVRSGQSAEHCVKRLDSAGERSPPVPPTHRADLLVRDEVTFVRPHVRGENGRALRALSDAKRESRIASEDQLFNLITGLLAQLADGRLPGGLPRIDHAAGKLPLLA